METFTSTAIRIVLATAGFLFYASVTVAQDTAADGPTTGVVAAATSIRSDQERLLATGRIVASRDAPKGVTGSRRVTLSDGLTTHDAHVQVIDQSEREFRGRGYTELNFRDSWRFNVAAYRLSLLLGLDMVPVTVERPYRGQPAAFTWWVDDVAMDEGGRLKNKIRPPDGRRWQQQMAMVRLFDQLIYNTDRNLGNLLITSDWRLWMIDHTRAFRRHRELRTDMAVRGCDRAALGQLRALDRRTLEAALGRYLEQAEIRAILARRDALLSLIDSAAVDLTFDLRHP